MDGFCDEADDDVGRQHDVSVDNFDLSHNKAFVLQSYVNRKRVVLS